MGNQWRRRTTDTNGIALSTSAPALAEGTGYVNQAMSQNFTHFNSNKAPQFDEDIAWFKSGSRTGTHNLKFGYQLHRNVNLISQGYNAPDLQVYPGISGPYTPIDPNVGVKNCATVEAETGYPSCTGTYGVININDYGTSGTATALNHGFFAQDAWTIGRASPSTPACASSASICRLRTSPLPRCSPGPSTSDGDPRLLLELAEHGTSLRTGR